MDEKRGKGQSGGLNIHGEVGSVRGDMVGRDKIVMGPISIGSAISGKHYIIGLDLGDGESCLSYVATNVSLVADRSIFRLSGKSTIPTIIAESVNGEMLIGEEAISRADATELEVNFKFDPVNSRREWEKRRDKLLLFVRELMARFEGRYPYVTDKCIIVIGCPSGWNEAARKIYEQHFNDQDLPNCYVVPESRAALIQAFDVFGYAGNRTAKERLRELVRRRVLVFDIGSSTTDVTLLKNLDPYEIGLGADLGLRSVDRQILITLYRTHPDGAGIRAKVEGDRGNERFFLYLCRLAKEQAFGRSIDTENLFEGREWAQDSWRHLLSLNLKGCLSEPFFWGEEVSWLDRFLTLLIEVKNAVAADEPDAILVTGGGSNISTLVKAIDAAFPAARAIRDPEPSLTVARGLAGYGKWLKNIVEFNVDAYKVIQDADLEIKLQSEITSFVGEVFTILVNSSVEAVWEPMAYKWKDEQLNLDQYGGLTSYIHLSYRTWLEKGNLRRFEPALERLAAAVNRELEGEIAKLGHRYKLPVGTFQLRLRFLPSEFFTHGAPGEGVLAATSKAFQIYQDLGFQIIDKVPLWVRKLSYSSGTLNLMLEVERIIKQVLASLMNPVAASQSGIQNVVLNFIKNEARREVEAQRDVVGKLLLSHHV